MTDSSTLRLLLARAIVIRPCVLIIDGTLHSIVPSVRAVIIRQMPYDKWATTGRSSAIPLFDGLSTIR